MGEEEAKAAADQPPAEGQPKLSKNQLKKLAKGKVRCLTWPMIFISSLIVDVVLQETQL